MTEPLATEWKSLWPDLGLPAEPIRVLPVGGGSIHRAFRACTAAGDFFVKCNTAGQLANFNAEADGLRALAACPALALPQVVSTAVVGERAYLVMQWLDLRRGGGGAALGEALAELHRVTADQFGWPADNFIGRTPQPNRQTRDWIDFWRMRLTFQLDRAIQSGGGPRLQLQGERLLDGLPVLLGSHAPAPSLLHGDLWSGNAGTLADGRPALFDPACYYGDREADVAMTELFGGFDHAFYAAYASAWPLDAGYPLRRELYNLYHILNHFNLFGGAYQEQAERIIARLLAEI